MSLPKWLTYLEQSPEMMADFIMDITRRKQHAQQAQDAATDFHEAKEALGRKKALDSLLASVNMQYREDASHAQYLADTGAPGYNGL